LISSSADAPKLEQCDGYQYAASRTQLPISFCHVGINRRAFPKTNEK
jgi:hypothetical protein